MIITIDGPAGVGKSTVAVMLAGKLDAAFLDTGAMYRAVTLAAMRKSIDPVDERQVLDMLERTDFLFKPERGVMIVFIDGTDVTADIRSQKITRNVRFIASSGAIRNKLAAMQRAFAAGCEKIVTEGRDQGTVVFPKADFKFFLSADTSERAKRRSVQLAETGDNVSLRQLEDEIVARDASDEKRAVGPLRAAADAIVIDTTNMNAEQVVTKMLSYIEGGTNA